MIRVLVTGGGGRVGRVLLSLVPADIEAETLLGPRDDPIAGFSWYRSDIALREKTIMAVTCASPDVVIHLAAMTDVDGCERDPETAFKVNRDGASAIAEACAACGARMVMISTDYVFDGRSGPYRESDVPDPVNTYGRSKLEGELACGRMLDRLAVVRISVPFGHRMPGAAHNFVSMLDERLAAGLPVRAVTDQFTTPSWMDELSGLVWAIARDDIRGIVHYGSSDRLSRFDMAHALCRARGYDGDLVEPVLTSGLGLAAPRPLESGFVTDRAADILGHPPSSFEAALRSLSTFGGNRT